MAAIYLGINADCTLRVVRMWAIPAVITGTIPVQLYVTAILNRVFHPTVLLDSGVCSNVTRDPDPETKDGMRYLTVFITFLLAPLVALAAQSATRTTPEAPSRVIAARQGIVTPPPCEAVDPPPTEEETATLFDLFVEAFITEADLSEAFKYIANDYIVSPPSKLL